VPLNCLLFYIWYWL